MANNSIKSFEGIDCESTLLISQSQKT